MGRAFEYRKATKLKRWGHMAKTFTRLGKQIAIAVKAGGPEPENNPALRSVIAVCKVITESDYLYAEILYYLSFLEQAHRCRQPCRCHCQVPDAPLLEYRLKALL